jgi:hypothetical protein
MNADQKAVARVAWVICLLLAGCYGRVATARLTSVLLPLREHRILVLPAEDYLSVRRELIAWVDSRVRSHESPQRMNDELKAAHLFSEGAQSVEDMLDRTFVGYVGAVAPLKVGGPGGVVAFKTGIHTGAGCNFDETVLIYRRFGLALLVQLNAQTAFTHGYYLRNASVGAERAGGRVVASSWVASNCTSNWNGELFRIDLVGQGSVATVLEQGVGAFAGNAMKIDIDGDTVTFDYETHTGETAALIREGILRYRVEGRRAVREAPIAGSYGGFISEWLEMEDVEAVPWASAAANLRHREMAALLRAGLFEYDGAADCEGTPRTREVAVRWSKTGRVTAFRLSGARATEMRLESVSDSISAGCRKIDIQRDIKSVLSDPGR